MRLHSFPTRRSSDLLHASARRSSCVGTSPCPARALATPVVPGRHGSRGRAARSTLCSARCCPHVSKHSHRAHSLEHNPTQPGANFPSRDPSDAPDARTTHRFASGSNGARHGSAYQGLAAADEYAERVPAHRERLRRAALAPRPSGPNFAFAGELFARVIRNPATSGRDASLTLRLGLLSRGWLRSATLIPKLKASQSRAGKRRQI